MCFCGCVVSGNFILLALTTVAALHQLAVASAVWACHLYLCQVMLIFLILRCLRLYYWLLVLITCQVVVFQLRLCEAELLEGNLVPLRALVSIMEKGLIVYHGLSFFEFFATNSVYLQIRMLGEPIH